MPEKKGSVAARRARFEDEAMPHLDALYAMAMRLMRNADDAADLLQDTVLRAYRFFDRYETGTNCRAWLFRILLNVLKKAAGKKRRDPLAEAEEVEGSNKVIPLFPDVEGGNRQDILAAVSHLTPEFRDVLWLVVVEGFPYKETAQMLDIPMGTVMSRLYRARRELRRWLTAPAVAAKERTPGHGM